MALPEPCREAVELVVVDKIMFKSRVKERLAEVYLALKQGDYSKVKELLLYLDL
jgi:glutamine synthetase